MTLWVESPVESIANLDASFSKLYFCSDNVLFISLLLYV